MKKFTVENLPFVIETLEEHEVKPFGIIAQAESMFIANIGPTDSIKVQNKDYDFIFDLVIIDYRNNSWIYSFKFNKVENNG